MLAWESKHCLHMEKYMVDLPTLLRDLCKLNMQKH